MFSVNVLEIDSITVNQARDEYRNVLTCEFSAAIRSYCIDSDEYYLEIDVSTRAQSYHDPQDAIRKAIQKFLDGKYYPDVRHRHTMGNHGKFHNKINKIEIKLGNNEYSDLLHELLNTGVVIMPKLN